MALIIGVVGSIATGKSTVSRILEDEGAIHCNGDTLVHQLYAPGTPGFDRVVAEFGTEIIAPDGTVDRKILGSKVFGDAEAMRRLTTAMGSISDLVKTVIDGWRRDLPPNGLAVLEAVNCIEAGYSAWFDQTWLVVADNDIARLRLMERNTFSEAEADQRLASQRDWRLREPASDVVIRNDGDLETLEKTVRAELARVRDLYAHGALPPRRYDAWRAEHPFPAPAAGAATSPATRA